jgi:porphobilinogen synthase
MRRMRRTKAIRDLVRETDLSAAHLVQPLFVVAGEGVREPVPSMPGIERGRRVGGEGGDPVRGPG